MVTNGLQICPKIPFHFCEKCQYITSNKKDFNKHLLTLKHKNGDKSVTNVPKNPLFACQCGKTYNYRQGLHRHSKSCMKVKEKNNLDEIKSLFEKQMKENSELKDLLMEQNNKIMEMANEKSQQCVIYNNTTNHLTNNVTNNFNLQVFLNEKCKDALNITDFVDSLKMQLTDLDTFGNLGYVEGISRIFIRGLKELDILKRPIHCSDVKRETMYVKDKDTWEKENEDKKKLRLLINHITDKNIGQITEWVNQNPDANNYDSKKHLEYIKILGQSMGGKTDEENQKMIHRIIKNVAKHVMIDK
jgi:hypothetical protein